MFPKNHRYIPPPIKGRLAWHSRISSSRLRPIIIVVRSLSPNTSSANRCLFRGHGITVFGKPSGKRKSWASPVTLTRRSEKLSRPIQTSTRDSPDDGGRSFNTRRSCLVDAMRSAALMAYAYPVISPKQRGEKGRRRRQNPSFHPQRYHLRSRPHEAPLFLCLEDSMKRLPPGGCVVTLIFVTVSVLMIISLIVLTNHVRWI